MLEEASTSLIEELDMASSGNIIGVEDEVLEQSLTSSNKELGTAFSED